MFLTTINYTNHTSVIVAGRPHKWIKSERYPHSRLRIWFFVTLTRIVFGSKDAKFSQKGFAGRKSLACDRDFWVTGLRQAQAASHSSPRFIPWGAFIFLRRVAKPHREQTQNSSHRGRLPIRVRIATLFYRQACRQLSLKFLDRYHKCRKDTHVEP